MSTIYGAEHLARLLVKLPEMVAHTTMDDASVALLREYVTELMGYAYTTHCSCDTLGSTLLRTP